MSLLFRDSPSVLDYPSHTSCRRVYISPFPVGCKVAHIQTHFQLHTYSVPDPQPPPPPPKKKLGASAIYVCDNCPVHEGEARGRGQLSFNNPMLPWYISHGYFHSNHVSRCCLVHSFPIVFPTDNSPAAKGHLFA